MIRFFKSLIKKKKKEDKTLKKICAECKNISVVSGFRRTMNCNKVPKEFFIEYESIAAKILMNTYGLNYHTDRFYFINLPKHTAMTKYDLFLCNECYEQRVQRNVMFLENNDELNIDDYDPHFDIKKGEYIWNEWTKL